MFMSSILFDSSVKTFSKTNDPTLLNTSSLLPTYLASTAKVVDSLAGFGYSINHSSLVVTNMEAGALDDRIKQTRYTLTPALGLESIKLKLLSRSLLLHTPAKRYKVSYFCLASDQRSTVTSLHDEPCAIVQFTMTLP